MIVPMLAKCRECGSFGAIVPPAGTLVAHEREEWEPTASTFVLVPCEGSGRMPFPPQRADAAAPILRPTFARASAVQVGRA